MIYLYQRKIREIDDYNESLLMMLPAELISLDSSLRTNLKQYIWVSSEVVNKIAVPQGDQQKLKENEMK